MQLIKLNSIVKGISNDIKKTMETLLKWNYLMTQKENKNE